jgi:putative endonuclease
MTTSAPGRDAATREASNYLEGIGFQIRDRDWHQPDGCLDIVAADRDTLVVCFLKVSSGTGGGSPLESLSQARRSLLRHLAVRWLSEHGARYEQIRVDVIRVTSEGPGGFTIEHIRGVA